MTYETFIFESYTINPDTRVAEFVYSYEDGPKFAETLTLPEGVAVKKSDSLDRALFALHLLLGVSYWKAYCPKNIMVNSGTLTTEQAAFWNTLYTKGLGQFFYENKLDPRGMVNFPVAGPVTGKQSSTPLQAPARRRDAVATSEAPFPVPPAASGKSIVPIGGGKDSLVTIELLQKAGIKFETYTLGTHAVTEEQRKYIRAPHYTIDRRIDSQLFKLNTVDAYNGHIPITAIYTFTSLLLAILNKDSYIVISSERSANEGNISYLGETINHQWSKSAEAEQLMRDYIHTWITPDVTYFSLLRPFSELAIAKKFSAHQKWLSLFTSCNTNFKIRKVTKKQWCGTCPKCAFVFAMLAPFVPKATLVKTFGKNLFADAALQPVYEELLGLKNFKPFECVGTPAEVRAAFTLAAKNGEYSADPIMQHAMANIPAVDDILITELLTPSTDHAIPQPFQPIIFS